MLCKNEYETAMFTKNSDILIKTRGDSDYEYVTLDEKVFEKMENCIQHLTV